MSHLLLALIAIQPIQVEEYVLENGLKILIYEDHFAPVVSTQLHYRVGAYNEPLGLTGISHLLEHMAFQGTKKYEPREYDRIIDEAGGEENAFTSTHRTVYYATLRSDRYALEIELEADRMQNLLIALEEFEPEKGVVMEERRLRENDPYSDFFEKLDLASYTYHPYRQPIIGFMGDLERMTRDDVDDWYRNHYNPANAFVVIAGSVDPEQAAQLVRKHFGKIKGIPLTEPAHYEPIQQGERRFELKRDIHGQALAIQFHTVPANHEDEYALDVISMILTSGNSSRLVKTLVREKGIASRISAFSSTSKYGGTFMFFGVPQLDSDAAILEQEIYDAIELLKNEAVSDEELEKAKNQIIAQMIYRMDSATGIGFTIGWWEIEGRGWHNMNVYPEKIQQVTPAAVMAVAQKYFIQENRTVGHLVGLEE